MGDSGRPRAIPNNFCFYGISPDLSLASGERVANKSTVLPRSAALRAYGIAIALLFPPSFVLSLGSISVSESCLEMLYPSYITRPTIRMLAIYWAALMGHPPGENCDRGVVEIVTTLCGLSGCMFSMTKLTASRLGPLGDIKSQLLCPPPSLFTSM